MKGIQNCTNQGPGPLQRGNNHKSAQIGLVILKSSQKPQSQKTADLHKSLLA
jgi:hypothetical protein